MAPRQKKQPGGHAGTFFFSGCEDSFPWAGFFALQQGQQSSSNLTVVFLGGAASSIPQQEQGSVPASRLSIRSRGIRKEDTLYSWNNCWFFSHYTEL
jgi:hypothetical protein